MTQFTQQFDRLCSVLNRLIWPTNHKVDRTTKTFFVFKPFPKHLKAHELEKWAKLQAKTLSPFNQGDHYAFISKLGLHLWFSASKLNGIPETAAQQPLVNGEHQLGSQSYLYQQQWQQGLLIACTSAPIHSGNEYPQIDNSDAWAIEGQLQTKLKQPLTWFIVALFITLCNLVWFTAGWLTLSIQQAKVEEQSGQLNEELSEKLVIQTILRDQQNTIRTLQQWQTQHGFLPESFSVIAEQLNLQGDWKTNLVTWQNKTMELEFVSKTIDITALIIALEKQPTLQQVNIRPHNADETWVLEAVSK